MPGFCHAGLWALVVIKWTHTQHTQHILCGQEQFQETNMCRVYLGWRMPGLIALA